MTAVKLILTESVHNLGEAGDVVNVRPGYARGAEQDRREQSIRDRDANSQRISDELQNTHAEAMIRLERDRGFDHGKTQNVRENKNVLTQGAAGTRES